MSVELPDAFRGGTGTSISTAFDLTGLTRRHNPAAKTEDYIAQTFYIVHGREFPKAWSDGIAGPELRRLPNKWLRDDADLRVAAPVGPQSHGRVAVVGGRLIEGDRWFWMLMLLPERVIDDAGGDAAAATALEKVLRTARTVPTDPAG